MHFTAKFPSVFLSTVLVFVLGPLLFAMNGFAQSSPPETAQSVSTEGAQDPSEQSTGHNSNPGLEVQVPEQSGSGHFTQAEMHFRAGVEAFQKGNYEGARASFHESLKDNQLNPVTLFNLGLVEFQAGKLGLSLGIWRKALALSSGYEPAQIGITWARGKLERSEIPHETRIWESFRKVALVPVSLHTYLLATALTLLGGGWLLLSYFGRRRTARLDERPMPSLPFSAIACLTALLFASSFSAAKLFDMRVVRGTILEKQTSARSSPDGSATPLFELYEGLEVIVRQSVDDWRQVTYPGGSTGWIPKKSVFATTDEVVP